jgi:two-component system chemotaxis response regulator CheB
MTDTPQIRVLIVDDSVVVRGSLGRIIDAEPDMRVVTTAVNGQDAVDALRHTEADVVLLDVEMPVMDGLTALPLILRQAPSVQVLMSSALTHDGAAVTMRALALGAVDFIHKPQAKDGVHALRALAEQLVAKVRAVGTRNTRNTKSPMGARGAGAAMGPVAVRNGAMTPAVVSLPVNGAGDPGLTAHPLVAGAESTTPRIVGIAASTGGPNALAALAAALPVDFPLPIVVTQHMPPIFTHMLAQRLSREGALACDEARDGEALVAGRIYVAPGDFHLVTATAQGTPVIRLAQGEMENHCRPSADPMFRSLAQSYGAGAVAVMLTGMGEDGRRGCEAVAAAGGRVIVQDEASSVVWGMPGSVVNAGIPCTILPLDAIVSHITALCCVRA